MIYKKHWRIGLLVLLVGLLAFGTGLIGASASGTCTPTPGNDPPASSLEPPDGCDELLEYKLDDEPPLNKTYTHDGFVVTISNMDGYTFDFEANMPVYYVFVKGGTIPGTSPPESGGCLYSYMSDGTYSGTGLGTPGDQEISHVTFYYCEPVPPEPAKITVNKSFIPTEASEMLDSIDVTLTGTSDGASHQDGDTQTLDPDDWTYTWEELEPGTYTLSEEELGGNWSVELDPDGDITLEAGDEKTVTITNTYEEEPEFGEIRIQKSINRARADDEDIKFTAEVEGPNDYYEEVEFSVEEPKLLEGLEFGEYTITEIDIPSPFSLVSGSPTTVTIDDGNVGDVQVVTITNTRPRNGNGPDPTGSITVNKAFVGEVGPGAADNAQTFTINVTGPENFLNQEFSVNNPWRRTGLDFGEYTIEEVDVPEGYTLESEAIDVTISQTSQDAVVTINNSIDEPERGSITVNKAFVGEVEPSAADNAQTFTINVTGPQDFLGQEFSVNESWSASDLPLGTYTIEEVNVPSGYSLETTAQTVTLTSENPGANITIENSIFEEIIVDTVPPAVPPVVEEPEEEVITPEEPAVEPVEEVIVVAEERELPRTGGFEFLFMGIGGALAGAGAFLKLRGRKK